MTTGLHGAHAPVEILLVEDNPGDVEITRECLEASRIDSSVHVVGDGALALEYLRRTGRYADSPRPDLIILDLNLPKKDGAAVLDEIKHDPSLRRIPVVILTSSGAEADIIKSYNLHANCYIVKPTNLDRFEAMVQSIEDFWFATARLPPE